MPEETTLIAVACDDLNDIIDKITALELDNKKVTHISMTYSQERKFRDELGMKGVTVEALELFGAKVIIEDQYLVVWDERKGGNENCQA